jgi:hypothetical protein
VIWIKSFFLTDSIFYIFNDNTDWGMMCISYQKFQILSINFVLMLFVKSKADYNIWVVLHYLLPYINDCTVNIVLDSI